MSSRFEDMKRGQAESLFPMIEDVLGDAGAAWQELDAIGVGTGPGNFTGIRIAVSAARGLALSLDKPAIGISSFEAIRHLAATTNGRSLAVLPAPRDQWLWQATDDSGAPKSAGLMAMGTLERHGHVQAPGLIGTWSKGMEVEATTDFDGVSVPDVAAGTSIPDFYDRLAPTVAELAARTLMSGADFERPAPLYIRPADAAPASDPPPVILP